MDAPSAFLLALLLPAGAGDLLNRVASEMRCVPVGLGHRLVNKREAKLFHCISRRILVGQHFVNLS